MNPKFYAIIVRDDDGACLSESELLKMCHLDLEAGVNFEGTIPLGEKLTGAIRAFMGISTEQFRREGN